jgi:diguanylate cyclase
MEAVEASQSIALAEAALDTIRLLRQPAVPRNYEIWYVYRSGQNPSLSRIVDELVAKNGTLDGKDCERVYQLCLAPSGSNADAEQIGIDVGLHLADILNHISTAAISLSEYDQGLSKAVSSLTEARDVRSIKMIVASLMAATREAKESNQDLKQRLQLTRSELNDLQRRIGAIQEESIKDSLTGLRNRRQFDRDLDDAVQTALAGKQPFSILMLDIDRFKSFNDSHGHLTGDHVLRLVAASLTENTRGRDLVARYGGEEFAILLPNTPLEQASIVAQNVRRAVMAKELRRKSSGERLGRITVSIGVAECSRSDDKTSLIERADTCLYCAKRAGRNRVVCQGDAEYLAGCEKHVA